MHRGTEGGGREKQIREGMRFLKKGKSVTVSFRMSEEEARTLRRNAKEQDMSESEYLRMMVRQRPTDYPEISELLRKLINEVNHIGVNINQIVKNHNSSFYTAEDKRRLTAYMKKISMAVKEVAVALGNK